MTKKAGIGAITISMLIGLAASAATPPDLMNYEGVLRDSLGQPENGGFDMTFRFFDTETVGTGSEILVDAHLGAGAGDVTVSDGLFSVKLGSGTVSDGSGAGSYTSLTAMFRDHATVWMEIVVNGETFDKRVCLVSAPFAANARYLEGRASTEFLDTSSVSQIKDGSLRIVETDGSLGLWKDPGAGDVPYLHFRNPDNGADWILKHDGPRFHVQKEGVPGTEVLTIRDNDSVGIGTTDPLEKLEVVGGNIRVDAPSNWGVVLGDVPGYAYPGLSTVPGAPGLDLFSEDWVRTNVDKGTMDFQGDVVNLYTSPATSDIQFRFNNNGSITWDHSSSEFEFSDSVDIIGTLDVVGAKNFVQNHPHESGMEIHYTTLEGDEAGTYTRGHGRLVNGEARIELGETFAWVTNPDIGLSATVTPRHLAVPLAVVSVSTHELVVRGPEDVVFDYMVMGLRIGYESYSRVQPGSGGATVPAEDYYSAFYAHHPELRRHSPLDRYRTMTRELLGRDVNEMPRADELRQQIGEHTPLVVPRVGEPAVTDRERDPARRADAAEPTPERDEAGTRSIASFHSISSVRTEQVAIGEDVEIGDVLVADPEQAGVIRVARTPADAAVVGIAAPLTDVDGADRGVAPATFDIVLCKVDAGYGSVRIGDLLTTSATPGHAMRAYEPLPGTILGKALEPLDHGTGLIRVLVMLR